MSEGNEVLFGHVEDDVSPHEVYTGDHNDVEHDRRTWPLSRKSSVSLGDSESGFQYSVSPSLAGFLGENRPALPEGNDGHGAPMGSRMHKIEPSTPRSAPDPGTGYLSDSQIPGSVRDVSSAVARSRLLNKKQNRTMKHAIAQGTVAPGQPSKVRRAKHKFLQVELDELDSTDVRFGSMIHSKGVPVGQSLHTLCKTSKVSLMSLFHRRSQLFWSVTIFTMKSPLHLQDQSSSDKQPVNVTAYCAAYELDLVELFETLNERFGFGSVTPYPEGSMDEAHLTAERTPDMLHATYSDLNGHVSGDVLFFEVCPPLRQAFASLNRDATSRLASPGFASLGVHRSESLQA